MGDGHQGDQPLEVAFDEARQPGPHSGPTGARNGATVREPGTGHGDPHGTHLQDAPQQTEPPVGAIVRGGQPRVDTERGRA